MNVTGTKWRAVALMKGSPKCPTLLTQTKKILNFLYTNTNTNTIPIPIPIPMTEAHRLVSFSETPPLTFPHFPTIFSIFFLNIKAPRIGITSQILRFYCGKSKLLLLFSDTIPCVYLKH